MAKKKAGKLKIEFGRVIDGVEYLEMTSEDHDKLEELGLDRIDPKCLIHWNETKVPGAPAALVLSADQSTVVEVYGVRTVDRKVGASVKNEADVDRAARGAIRLFGIEFVPMTEADYNFLDEAPEGSFIHYEEGDGPDGLECDDNVILVVTPEKIVWQITFDEDTGIEITKWAVTQVE